MKARTNITPEITATFQLTATAKPVKAGRRPMFGIGHTLRTVESVQSSNVLHRTSVSQQGKRWGFVTFWRALETKNPGNCESLYLGRRRVNFLVVVHHYVLTTFGQFGSRVGFSQTSRACVIWNLAPRTQLSIPGQC